VGFAGLVTQVYVDVMLAVNLVMDFFILWAVGRLAHLPIKTGRLLLGAVLGAAYSLVIFFPESTILNSLGAKIACSLLMILVAYYPLKIKVFLYSVAYLYMISFAMGGAVIAAAYLADNSSGYVRVFSPGDSLGNSLHYGWLLMGILVALIIGWGGLVYLRRNRLQQELINSLTIALPGRTLQLKALLDTGNQLSEPLTNRPVVVVEAGALQQALPKSIWNALQHEELEMVELAAGLEPEWASRLRLIPYSSVGKNNGMMAGIRPDWVEVTGRVGSIRSSNVILGLVYRTLSREGRYQALLPPAIFEEN